MLASAVRARGDVPVIVRRRGRSHVADGHEALKDSKRQGEGADGQAGRPVIGIKRHRVENVAPKLHRSDLDKGRQDPDAHEDGIIEHATHHVEFVEDAPAVDLVEELHPHEGVVDDGVAEQPYLAMSAQPRTSDKYACTHLCAHSDKSCRGVRKYR